MAGLVSFTSNAELDRMRGDVRDQSEVKSPDPTITALGAHVYNCFSEAKQAKDEVITGRLLKCLRDRKGEYDPAFLAQLRANQGGSEIFMLLPDIKCRAAEAWIKDVLIPAGDRAWTLESTPVPDIHPELAGQIMKSVIQEAEMQASMGFDVSPWDMLQRANQIYDETLRRTKEAAEECATRHARKIEDQMVEGGWREAFAEWIVYFTTYPTAFMKGPFKRPKKSLAWGQGYTPRIVTKEMMTWYPINPFDAYPSPTSSNINAGYFNERRQFVTQELEDMYDMGGRGGYDQAAIKRVLMRHGAKGYRTWLFGDMERGRLEDKSNQAFISPANTIEGIEYSGPVPGQLLIDWGVKGQLVPWRSYECNVLWVAHEVIRAMINPHPLGRRPITAASFINVPGSIWGKAIPEAMCDITDMCNSLARAVDNNLGMSAVPMTEIYVDRLAEGEKVKRPHSGAVYQTTSDRSSSNNPAVRFFQPESRAPELVKVMDAFEVRADDRTGIPRYAYGNPDVGGGGNTAHGLSMLFGAAAKGIKSAIFNADVGVVEGNVSMLWEHNMMYDPDPSIKGEMNIKARGAAALLVKEVMASKRNEFLAATNNPLDIQIMGILGRAALLRAQVRDLDMPADKVIPDELTLKENMAAQQAAGIDPTTGNPVPGGPADPAANGAQPGQEPQPTPKEQEQAKVIEKGSAEAQQLQKRIADLEADVAKWQKQASDKEEDRKLRKYEIDQGHKIQRETSRASATESRAARAPDPVMQRAVEQFAKRLDDILAEVRTLREAEKEDGQGGEKEGPDMPPINITVPVTIDTRAPTAKTIQVMPKDGGGYEAVVTPQEPGELAGDTD